MEYEFVEFYPVLCKKKNDQIVGTIHIYLHCKEIQFDLRGILVALYKNKLYFRMPGANGADPETKQMIRYPFFGFTNKEEEDSFRKFLAREVDPIIRDRLKLSPLIQEKESS